VGEAFMNLAPWWSLFPTWFRDLMLRTDCFPVRGTGSRQEGGSHIKTFDRGPL
jgi:hypothetical protein